MRILTFALLLSAAAVSGCATKPITITEVETVEVVRYETVPVPDALLRACSPSLAALESNADLERTLAESLLCNRQHNADKDAIRNLE